MTFRTVANSLAMLALLGFTSRATAQEEKPKETTPKPAAKAKAKGSEKKKADDTKVKTEKATFGGGCFWCLEAVFERIPGVTNVVSGYSGGSVPRPTYDQVCTGLTGHAEVVQIEYDPEKVSYDKLLQVFFACHDPTTFNRQGPDFGTQYRSVIFYHNDEQKIAAKKEYDELTAKHYFNDPIVTDLVPLKIFYPAEKYHQDYYKKHPTADYCLEQIEPKLRKLKLK